MVSQINMPDAQRHAALLADAEAELAKLAFDASRYVDKKAGRGAVSSSTSPPVRLEPLASERHNVVPLPRGRGSPLSIRRFTMTFLLGVAATLGWQSYGSVATERLAPFAPELASLLLPAMPSEHAEKSGGSTGPVVLPLTAELEQQGGTNSSSTQAPAPAEAPPYREIIQRLEAIIRDVGEMRGNSREVTEMKAIVQSLAVGQRAITSDLAKLQEAQALFQARAAQSSSPRQGSQTRGLEPVQRTPPATSSIQSPGALPPPPPRPPMPLR
jgi:hypothetical protein